VQREETVTCAERKTAIKLVDKNKSLDNDALDDFEESPRGFRTLSAFSVSIFTRFSTWYEPQSVPQPQPLEPPVS